MFQVEGLQVRAVDGRLVQSWRVTATFDYPSSMVPGNVRSSELKLGVDDPKEPQDYFSGRFRRLDSGQ